MNLKHGKSSTPTYRMWQSMVGRCKYPSHTSWKWYGAVGVCVCERWLTFENFLEDMGEVPFIGASIERRNSKGNYEPSNCFWATPKQQARNRSNNLRLTLNGVTKTAVEWSEQPQIKIHYDLILDRKAKGWSDERALTHPVRRTVTLTVNGVTKTRKEWAEATGVKAGTIWHRLSRGRSTEQAIL